MSAFEKAPTLVLDLDGTLVDTAPDLLATLNVMLARESRPPLTLTQVRSMVGAGAKALLVRGLAASGDVVSPERLEELYADFLDYYVAHIADHSQPFPGAVDALTRFRADGWRLAVCTNKLEGLSRRLLDELGLTSRFDAICGGDTFEVHKPDPRHISKTVERAGGDPQLAVMVGDSNTDIAAAKAGAIPVVAVTFGYTDIPVREFGPDRVIEHFEHLFDAAHELLARVARSRSNPVSHA